MSTHWILAVPLVLVALEAEAKPAKWNMDKDHSEIGFAVRHLGITNTKGKFREFDAQVEADGDTGKLTSIVATAQAKTVDTDNSKRDDHLRSDDFFNAAEYPVLTFESKSFKWDGNDFTALVDMTIRNVTKPVTFKGELIGTHKVNFGDGEQIRAGYTATATINRQEFGLRFNKLAEGVSVVADQVKITIEIEMSRKLGTS